MSSTKFLNDPAGVVEDYITALVSSGADLVRVDGWPVVVRGPRSRKSADRVVLVTGGGSGHEPAHAGYVGLGMLDAAVLGPVFTSPSVDAVYAAIRTVATDAGVLLIVKNYTGDRLNFGLAAEMARADGIRVEMVVVADDAALGDTSRAGRRGLSATVLAHKVAGAAAESGAGLDEVAAVVRRLLAGAATMGVALGAATVPGAVAASFDLDDDEIEWGLGIHGEAGSSRGRLRPSRDLAGGLVERIASDRGLTAGDDVVVLVNGLGGTPDLELRILHGDVLAEAAVRGLRVRMTWAGPFLTSLDMPGASVTLARVDDELLTLLGAPARVLAFPAETPVRDPDAATTVPAPAEPPRRRGTGAAEPAVETVHAVTRVVAETLLAHEPELTDLDRRVGDGDLGVNLARGARAVLAAEGQLRTLPTPADHLAEVSDIVRREVGGTSGPLYSILLLAMSERLHAAGARPAAEDWTDAARGAVARIRTVGGAAPGDSTMIDALQPMADLLDQGIDAAARAARAGAEGTAGLRAALGRSSYVGERSVGVPDPGAIAVAHQLEAIAAALGARA